DRRDLRGNTRDVDDRDRSALAWQAEQFGDKTAHRIRHQHAREHEGVTRVRAELLELGLEALERNRVAGAVELAHLVDNDRVEIGRQIGDRAVYGDLAVLAPVLALGAGGEQAL